MKTGIKILAAAAAALCFCTSAAAEEAISEAEAQLLTSAVLMKFDGGVSCPVMNAYAGMILNRTADSRFPDSAADVILSLGYRGNIAAMMENADEKQLRMARDAAESALLGMDLSEGALWCVTEEEAENTVGRTVTFSAEGYVFLK